MSETPTEKKVRSYGGATVEVEMSDGSRVRREVTPVEAALWKEISSVLMTDTHGVWHQFNAEVLEAGADNDARDELAEAFAEKHPEWVTLADCDNDRFMSSTLVLVRHGTGDNYMGMSVVYLSQGEAHYSEFFLYPEHAAALLSGLVSMQPELAGSLRGSPSGGADEPSRRENKPSSFDAFFNRWREKPWYGTMGYRERLEHLAG